MNTQTDTGSSALDKLLLLVAAAILVGGVVAYYYFDQASLLLRSIGVVAGVGVGLFVASRSNPGKDMWHFIQASRGEIRKVVWPTRQDAMRTTLAVLAFAIILGVFFWGLDLVLGWGAKTLTGRGGA